MNMIHFQYERASFFTLFSWFQSFTAILFNLFQMPPLSFHLFFCSLTISITIAPPG